jgi:hypothetical protein
MRTSEAWEKRGREQQTPIPPHFHDVPTSIIRATGMLLQ